MRGKQPLRAIRVNGKTVQTAIWTMSEESTERVITLVGTFHVADLSYYQRILALIDETEAVGGLIQSERMTRSDDDVILAAATDDERRAVAAKFPSNEQREPRRRHYQRFGLVWEGDVLPRRPHWRYPDVDKVTYIRLLGVVPQKTSPSRVERWSAKKLAQVKSKNFRTAIRFQVKRASDFEQVAEEYFAYSAAESFRDQHAALDLLAIPGPANVLAIWVRVTSPGSVPPWSATASGSSTSSGLTPSRRPLPFMTSQRWLPLK